MLNDHAEDFERSVAQAQLRMVQCFQLAIQLVRQRRDISPSEDTRRDLNWCLTSIDSIAYFYFMSSTDRDRSFPSYLYDSISYWQPYTKERKVSYRIDSVDDVALSDEQAVRLEFITHELVSNALRHAFPDGRRDGRQGCITVSLRTRNEVTAELSVRDDGCGLDRRWLVDDDEEDPVPSGGFSIIRALVEDLGWSFDIVTAPSVGTVARVRLTPASSVV